MAYLLVLVVTGCCWHEWFTHLLHNFPQSALNVIIDLKFRNPLNIVTIIITFITVVIIICPMFEDEGSQFIQIFLIKKIIKHKYSFSLRGLVLRNKMLRHINISNIRSGTQYVAMVTKL